MPGIETSLAPLSSKVLKDDWTKELAAAGAELGVTLTITAATVTADNGAIIGSKTVQPTSVLFKPGLSAVPAETVVTVVTTVTLSNGDVDLRYHRIQVTNT